MSVLASLITAVWQLVKKTHKKRHKRNACAEIIDKNKEVEEFGERQPIVERDYTERRWESTCTGAGHWCDNNCTCNLIKAYSRALETGDSVTAEKIKAGTYIPALQGEQQKRTLSDYDVQRLDKIQKKISEKQDKRKIVKYSKPTNNQKHKPLPYALASNKHKYSDTNKNAQRSIKCCKNEQCGCHLVQEYTKALDNGDKELPQKIAKSMSFDTEWIENNSSNADQSISENQDFKIIHNPKTDSIDRNESNTLQNLSADNKDFPKTSDVNKSDELNYEHIKGRENKDQILSSQQNVLHYGLVTNDDQSLGTEKDIHNTSFHQHVPHYYAHNENQINQMKHRKKVKKIKKKKNTSNSKKIQFLKSRLHLNGKVKVKRYNSLMEDSDSSCSQAEEYEVN